MGRFPEAFAIRLAHQLLEIRHQHAGDRARLVVMPVDRAHRYDLGSRAAQEYLAGLGQFLRPHGTLLDRPAALSGEAHPGAAGDAVEKGHRRWRHHLVVDHQEDVGARRFGEVALPVEHQRIVEPGLQRAVLLDAADDVEARLLGVARREIGRWAAIFRHGDVDAGVARHHRQPALLGPRRDGEMHRRADARDAHDLRAAPGDRAYVTGLQAIRLHHGAGRLLDLGARPRDLVTEQTGGVDQPGAVGGQAEDAAVVDALALEYRGAVMQRMGQHMDAAVAPGHQLAVEPNEAVAIIHG